MSAMRLIFIRHGDPDYEKDSLTAQGWKEARLLAKRVAKWNVTDFYVSPLGRAQDTASLSLKKTRRAAETHEWLKEFYVPVKDPSDGHERIPWDLLPEYFYSEEKFLDRKNWLDTDFMKSGEVEKNYREVCDGLDSILRRYDFERSGLLYKTSGKIPNPNFDSATFIKNYHLFSNKAEYDGRTAVFFCHLGVMFAMISHLVNCSPLVLWQGFYVAPTSVTVLNSEERVAGKAAFRVERLGDTTHLHDGRQRISSSGYYAPVLQELGKAKI